MSINVSSNFLLSAQLPLDARTVAANIAARDAIPAIQRYEGLWCYVIDSDGSGTPATYQLQNGVTNSDWVLIGSGTGITGSGNPTSIALWNTATELTANVFFTRSNATGVVFNNQGFTADYDVDVERYIDPAGNDSNTGTSSGPANAWLTPAHAIEQCQQMGPGRYIINCAAGTYTSVTFDVPDVISRGLDGSYIESVIQFEGDQTTPSNVVFSNTSSSLIYNHSKTTTLRLHGVTLQGNVLNNGTAIIAQGGKIVFRNCNANNFFTVHNGSNSNVYTEVDFTMTDVYFGFSGVNCTYNIGGDITQTAPSPATQPPKMFSCTDSVIYFGSGGTYNIVSPFGAATGNLFDLRFCTVSFGQFNTFKADEVEQFFVAYGCNFLVLGGNTFIINGASTFMSLLDQSVFRDNATSSWIVDNIPVNGIRLSTDSIFISDIVLAEGVPPITFLQDYMTTYVQYPAETTYTAYASDNRYLEHYGFTCFGELPQGYSLANLSPQGLASDAYYLFVAPYNCQIVQLMVGTRVANGAAHTDTYIVGVNGASSAMSVAITNGDAGTATSPVVNVVSGDVISIRLTTDAATEAQDVTVQIAVRRYS